MKCQYTLLIFVLLSYCSLSGHTELNTKLYVLVLLWTSVLFQFIQQYSFNIYLLKLKLICTIISLFLNDLRYIIFNLNYIQIINTVLSYHLIPYEGD